METKSETWCWALKPAATRCRTLGSYPTWSKSSALITVAPGGGVGEVPPDCGEAQASRAAAANMTPVRPAEARNPPAKNARRGSRRGGKAKLVRTLVPKLTTVFDDCSCFGA